MSDGMFSAHAALNAGAIPASAEELSQRYIKLFQQYSRLKAQHAVLKKAVIKEQASNVALQGNVKEKEKELRKLQEQLDLLAFHNERLTKRIQAVQDSDQKGSHFSLLGGSVKKELEKSSQALEEANLDLERKIQENEDLHKELKDRQLEFTDNINNLLKQIQDLEKKVNELQDENAAIQSESKNTVVKEEESKLLHEIETLKKELQEKSDLIHKKEDEMKENDVQLLSEIQSLRSILLAKVGNIDTSLYDVIPESANALKELEDKTKSYILSNGEKNDLDGLPFEIAEKLALSNESYSNELAKLLTQLEELNKLSAEKDEKLSASENELQEKNEKISDLISTINKNTSSVEKLQELNGSLEQENQKLTKELEEKNASLSQALKDLDDTKNELNVAKESLEKAIQDNQQLAKSQEESKKKEESRETKPVEEPKKDDAEEDEDVFVYPTNNTTIDEPTNTNETNTTNNPQEEEEEEEDEEEVFVYRGMDAVPEETKEPEETAAITEPTPAPTNTISEEDMTAREDKLKAFYEQKLNTLTEKIQLTDSKAYRFASMYKNLKEKLVKEEKEKELMMQEIDRLNKEVKNVQDLLSTTESNYQKQIDTMTEFITSLQQNVEDRQYNNRR